MRSAARACLPACILALAVLATASGAGAEKRPPNIVIFLSDDVGYGEYGFQGYREIPTPNIDSIARSGVRFTQGYVSGPYCSPTRAGLLTGRYQTRFGDVFNGGGPMCGQEFGLTLKEKIVALRTQTLCNSAEPEALGLY